MPPEKTTVKDTQALVEKGWTFRVVTNHDSRPTLVWRAWISWRRGARPHKEESKVCDTLGEAISWAIQTAENWVYD